MMNLVNLYHLSHPVNMSFISFCCSLMLLFRSYPWSNALYNIHIPWKHTLIKRTLINFLLRQVPNSKPNDNILNMAITNEEIV